MKKLIIIVIMILGLGGCSYSPMDNSKPVIITEIQKYNDVYCDYFGYGNFNMSSSLNSKFKFRDKLGKYQVGDTVKFCK